MIHNNREVGCVWIKKKASGYFTCKNWGVFLLIFYFIFVHSLYNETLVTVLFILFMKVLTNDATSCTNYPLIVSLKTLDDRLDKCILEMHQLKKILCFECIISVNFVFNIWKLWVFPCMNYELIFFLCFWTF